MEFDAHDILRLQVFTSHLCDIDNKLLLSEISNTENNIPDHLRTPFGSVTTHTWFEDGLFPWGMPESEKLILHMQEFAFSVLGREMVVDEAWTITLNNGQSVMSHSHRSNWHMFPHEYFSIAYYANAPHGSAPLVFETGYCDIAQSTYSVIPDTGMIVLFNSFIKHMTGRHESPEQRVVISANLSPMNPTTTRVPDLSPYRIGITQ